MAVPPTARSAGYHAPAMTKPRARDLGIRIGLGAPGPLNAITDVPGVRVGHRTVVRGRRPACRPHRRDRDLPAARANPGGNGCTPASTS